MKTNMQEPDSLYYNNTIKSQDKPPHEIMDKANNKHIDSQGPYQIDMTTKMFENQLDVSLPNIHQNHENRFGEPTLLKPELPRIIMKNNDNSKSIDGGLSTDIFSHQRSSLGDPSNH